MTLPNFLVIGAGRAGTTSLYTYLDEHPDVFMSRIKEPNFFLDPTPRNASARYAKTLAEYEALFADAGGASAIGEASVVYFRHPSSAARIKATLGPDVNLILILRQPAMRAFSGYLLSRRGDGQVLERRSAAEALLNPESGFERSYYADSLERWLDLFPDRLKILIFERYVANLSDTLRQVFEHIGVDPAFEPDFSRRYNEGWVPRNAALNRVLKHRRLRRIARSALPAGAQSAIRTLTRRNQAPAPSIDPALYEELTQRYLADIRRTEELIGEDLSHWLQPPPVTASTS